MPYDKDVVDKPISHAQSNTVTSSNWESSTTKSNQSLEISSTTQQPSIHQNDLSTLKDKENIVPWGTIKGPNSSYSCDSENKLGHKIENKHDVSNENVVDSNRKIVDDNFTETVEQHTRDVENVNVSMTSLHCLPNLKLQLNNSTIIVHDEIVKPETNCFQKQSPVKDALVSDHLEYVDIKKSSNQTSCVENIKKDVNTIDSNADMFNGLHEVINDDAFLNSNNNNTIINDQENDGFCDFETALPNFQNVPLPNRTPQVLDEITTNIQPVEQSHALATQPNLECDKILRDVSALEDYKLEQNSNSTYSNCSTFQNHLDNDIYSENISDSEFDEFCDFHTFSTPITGNPPTVNQNYLLNTESNSPKKSDSIEVKHSNNEHVKSIVTTDINSTLKSDNQNDITNDDDNFCDFESGFPTSAFRASDQISSVHQSDEVLDSKLQVNFDYKQFCNDIFQGDYVSVCF